MMSKYIKSISMSLMLMMVFLFINPVNAISKNLSITVNANDYQIIDMDDGQKIVMEDFGYLRVPGKPMLPAKNFLIALPPGAKVISVDVNPLNSTQLPGIYNITPTPAILPLSVSSGKELLVQKMMSEWEQNKRSVYLSDRSYPQEKGTLKGSGTLRKYSYASVSFYPFSFHPQSGKLIYHETAEVIIEYALPTRGSIEARKVEELNRDIIADKRAEDLFINYDQIADLYKADDSPPEVPLDIHNYVIITTEDLYDAVLASDFYYWKLSLGYSMRIVRTTDSEIAGSPGIDLAQKIRNFLRSNYAQWGIKYVLLVGDYETIPMRYCYPDSSNHLDGTGNPGNWTWAGEVPTDYYYADLSYSDAFSWDLDRDGFYGEYRQDDPDFLAEVYVGRIPTNNTDRITYTLDKIVAYEQDTGAWKGQVLHAGAIAYFENENYSGRDLIDGAETIDLIETDILYNRPISHYSEQEGLAPSALPWSPLSESAFISDWRNGQYGIVNWYGHGWSDGVFQKIWSWDDGDGVPESNEMYSPAFLTTNSNLDDDYPSIVFALSCMVGYAEPNPYGNIGIDLLTKPSYGASVGIVSATRVGWVSKGGGEEHEYEFNRYLHNGPEKLGEAMYNSQYYVNQTYDWDHYAEFWNLFGFNLYGDPSLVHLGIPAPALTCDVQTSTPRVPSVDGSISWDLTVYNNGSVPANVYGEIYPTIGDCASGTQYDFDLSKNIVNNLTPGASYTGYYYYYPGTVTGISEASLVTMVGTAYDDYIAADCFGFTFTYGFGNQGHQVSWNRGKWEEREIEHNIPTVTSLKQNYPNPFNAETIIPFELKNPGDVNISIYNLAGQVVGNLIDGSLAAGQHTINWDASKYSSGVYFYKLQVGSFVTTKKMNLLK